MPEPTDNGLQAAQPGARAAAARRLRSAALSCLLLLTPATSSWAISDATETRDLLIDRWDPADGLPQMSALAVAQDARGYLWVGTQKGVARFDGVRFEVFDSVSTDMRIPIAMAVFVDSRDRVWFATPVGVLRFENDRPALLRREGRQVAVTAVAEHGGRMLAATDIGLHEVRDDRLVPLEGSDDAGYSLLADGDRLWLGGRGMVRDAADPDSPPLRLPDQSQSQVVGIAAHRGRLWLATMNGVFVADPARGSVEPAGDELQGFPVTSLMWDRDENLWIGTRGALLRQLSDGRLERIDQAGFGIGPLVTSLWEDREGSIWVGSMQESLLRLRPNFVSTLDGRDGVHPLVWGMEKDDQDRLLIITQDGVLRREHDDSIIQLIEPEDISHAEAHTMEATSDGGFWLGTRNGLMHYKNGVVTQPAALAPLRSTTIYRILPQGENDYWLGTNEGLYRLRGDLLEHVAHAPGDPSSRIRSMLVAGDTLLLGTENGLRTARDGTLATPDWAGPLAEVMISTLAEVEPGLLAVGTQDNGIGLIHLDSPGPGPGAGLTGRVRMLTARDGLPSNNALSLDSLPGFLYVATINGVYRIHADSLAETATPPLVIEALHSVLQSAANRLQRQTCCVGGGGSKSLPDGDLIWYASTSGATYIDTTRIPEPLVSPPTRVERIANAQQRFGPEEPVRLENTLRDVTIDYTGLSLFDSSALLFRYRLLGYDQDWQSAGTRRSAFYTRLPPGSYQFVAQSRYPASDWGPASAPLTITVVPRWYERRGLQALALLLAAALCLGLIALRVIQSRRRERELEAAVIERTHALQRVNAQLRDANSALAHESRTDPLTGLSNRRVALSHASDTGVVAVLDIDHFKQINDNHGHAVGDRVLVEIARLLCEAVRSDDQVVRWGGEEFLLFLNDVNLHEAKALCERVRARIGSHVFPDVQRVTCSIGMAAYSGDWETATGLADAALYRAKRAGRDRCCGLVVIDATAVAKATLPAQVDELIADGDLAWLRSPKSLMADPERPPDRRPPERPAPTRDPADATDRTPPG